MGISGMGISGLGILGMGKKNHEYELSTYTRVSLSVLAPVLANVIPLPAYYWVSTRDRHHAEYI